MDVRKLLTVVSKDPVGSVKWIFRVLVVYSLVMVACMGLVFIILLVSGCAPYLFRGDPDYVTPKYGIKIWFKERIYFEDESILGRYFDASEESLRSNDIRIRISKVALYPPWTLKLDGEYVSGIAYRKRLLKGVQVVWYGDPWYLGAKAYGHERLHQAGFKHSKPPYREWYNPLAKLADEESREAGRLAAYPP